MENPKIITRDELAGMNGKQGRPAYVAVDGLIYDVSASPMWKGGEHMDAHDAGLDLSADIRNAPHPMERVKDFPVVGVLEGTAVPTPLKAAPAPGPSAEVAPAGPPALVRLAKLIHAHPASVHYPVALMSVASLLQFADMVLGCEVCALLAFYNLVIGLAFAPIAIFSGLVDWFWYYGGKFRGWFRAKMLISAALLVLATATIYVKLNLGPDFDLLYQLMVLAHAPVVFLLGFIGGRITFHSHQ
jgi:predicted heme/steroid binding protein/uncharacterized membrane protein